MKSVLVIQMKAWMIRLPEMVKSLINKTIIVINSPFTDLTYM